MYIYMKKKGPSQKKRNKTARYRAKLARKNTRRRIRVSKGNKW